MTSDDEGNLLRWRSVHNATGSEKQCNCANMGVLAGDKHSQSTIAVIMKRNKQNRRKRQTAANTPHYDVRAFDMAKLKLKKK